MYIFYFISYYIYFLLYNNLWFLHLKKSLHICMSYSYLPMIFTCPFFTSRSLIYLDSIFVCGMRKGTNYIFCHMDSHLSQHHLLNGLFLPSLYGGLTSFRHPI